MPEQPPIFITSQGLAGDLPTFALANLIRSMRVTFPAPPVPISLTAESLHPLNQDAH